MNSDLLPRVCAGTPLNTIIYNILTPASAVPEKSDGIEIYF